ncbi:O-antigen ligase family protein [Priestia aryabhattai]|uniref:O-antigen ligase family protein n=1 Tax=Priestia aryabhattai TaxID=412384 RepID=UPI001C8E45E6|nr:hypothetical protein [Priestia aryabhattai]MBX9988615.1 hypothetical protein [Priestia aryabhattai]
MNTITTKKRFRTLVNMLVYSGTFAAVYGCIQYFFGLSNYVLQEDVYGNLIYRSVGAFGLANVFATFLAMIIPFIIYKIKITKNKFSKFINVIFLALSLMGLYFSYSRWAIVCLLITFAMYSLRRFVHRVIHKKISVFKITFLFPILIGVCIYYVNKYSETINTLFFDRGSNDIRGSNLTFVLQNFKPWGSGLGNGNQGVIVDSNYVNVLIDTGVVGLALFLLLILTIYGGLRKRAKGDISFSNIHIVTALSFLVFILNGILETPLYNSVINIFLGIYIFVLNADKSILPETEEHLEEAQEELKVKHKRKKRKKYRLTW